MFRRFKFIVRRRRQLNVQHCKMQDQKSKEKSRKYKTESKGPHVFYSSKDSTIIMYKSALHNIALTNTPNRGYSDQGR